MHNYIVYKDSFISSFPILILFFLLFLGLLAHAFNSTVNRSDEVTSKHPYLIPVLRGKAYNTASLSMMFAIEIF